MSRNKTPRQAGKGNKRGIIVTDHSGKKPKKSKTDIELNVGRLVLATDATTPFVDNECNKSARQMNSSTWNGWEKRGKWHSMIVTVAAHWLLEKDGEKRGDYKATMNEFFDHVSKHPLITKESEKVKKSKDDIVDFSPKYTKKVWNFIHTEFTTYPTDHEPDVKWIYMEVDEGNPIIYNQREFKFKLKWPTKREIEKRNKKPKKASKYIEGVVDRTWWHKLVEMERKRDAQLTQAEVKSGGDRRQASISSADGDDVESNEDDRVATSSGNDDDDDDLATTHTFKKNTCPVSNCPPPIINGKIVKDLVIESITLARKCSNTIIPGYLTVSAKFSDVCTDLYKNCEPESIKMHIPQEHILDDYTEEATTIVTELNKATLFSGNGKHKKGQLISEAVVFAAEQDHILDGRNTRSRSTRSFNFIRLTTRPAYIIAARKLEMNKTGEGDNSTDITGRSTSDHGLKEAEDDDGGGTAIFLPQSSPCCCDPYIAVVTECVDGGCFLELAGGMCGYVEIPVGKNKSLPDLWSTIVVEIQPMGQPFTYGPENDNNKTHKYLRCVMSYEGDSEEEEDENTGNTTYPKFSINERKLIATKPVKLNFKDSSSVWSKLLEKAGDYTTQTVDDAIKNYEWSTSLSRSGLGLIAYQLSSKYTRSKLQVMDGVLSEAISRLFTCVLGLSGYMNSLTPRDNNQTKDEYFQEIISVKCMMARKTGRHGKTESDPHIRFGKDVIEEMKEQNVHEKAYIGFLPLTNGKSLTMKVWDEPWSTWNDVGEDNFHGAKTVNIPNDHLYILPAEAVHTEMCDEDVDYMVMIIAINTSYDPDKSDQISLDVKNHVMNFKASDGESLKSKMHLQRE